MDFETIVHPCFEFLSQEKCDHVQLYNIIIDYETVCHVVFVLHENIDSDFWNDKMNMIYFSDMMLRKMDKILQLERKIVNEEMSAEGGYLVFLDEKEHNQNLQEILKFREGNLFWNLGLNIELQAVIFVDKNENLIRFYN
jgi:hypothetical protein